ncbi:MAG: tRNA (guanosine(37)-N1)-methyltransferase TrmD [bacterium]|nr:tRNA (guanosine(37)-N1)-methyltransferase TrmD [bacterium]
MPKLRFDILTLFPQFFASPLKESLLQKALAKDLLEINLLDIRDFGEGPHKKVDDSPFGGGEGMVLRVDVLSKALSSVKRTKNSQVILLSPGGTRLTQKLAAELVQKEQLILVAGRYEGVDQRFTDLFVDQEISIGDYILNGGETAALVVLETVARLVPGFVGKEKSTQQESFSVFELEGKKQMLLEYPHYTRPAEFQGQKVPEILLSGNHEKIKKWRHETAFEKTKKVRPDLLD